MRIDLQCHDIVSIVSTVLVSYRELVGLLLRCGCQERPEDHSGLQGPLEKKEWWDIDQNYIRNLYH